MFESDAGLKEMFNVIATSKTLEEDDKGLEFVAAIEGKQYPFFGT